MSAVVQIPGSYCLTSMVQDVILTSAADLLFEVRLAGATILSEHYSPDSEGKVFVRDLGRLFEAYLSGDMKTGERSCTIGTFTFFVDGVQMGTTTAILCRAYTEQDPAVFYTGLSPLHLQYGAKVTIPTALEYLTLRLSAETPLEAKVIYRSENSIITSDPVTLEAVTSAGYYTFEITLAKIVALFPTLNPYSILSYQVGAGVMSQFDVDWQPYQDTKIFRYLNTFGCPATLVTRGQIMRKRAMKFESTRIHRLEKRFDIRREDTFQVAIGRKFSMVDDALMAEMLTSELVEVYYHGSFREIVITEEDSEELQCPGGLQDSSFTFRFADERFNAMLYDPSWILEDGTWSDQSDWMDEGFWND